MQCHDIGENLSAYIDGMLDQRVASLVEQHLESCSQCRAEYEDLLAAVELLRELPQVEPPPGFRDDLRERLLAGMVAGGAQNVSKPATRSLFWTRQLRLIVAAAVVLLTVGITALWYGEQVLFTGKDMVARESHITQNESSDLDQVDNAGNADNMAALRASEEVDELRMDFTPTSESVPEVRMRQSDEAPSDLEVHSSPGIAGGGNDEPVDAGSFRVPGVEEEAGFSIMAAPGTEIKEPQQIIPDLTEEEKSARDAAPPGLGGGSVQAVEYSVTLQVYDRQKAIRQVTEAVENCGGRIEAQPSPKENYMLISVPFQNARTLIEEIGQVGSITHQESKRQDLAPVIQQIESNISELEAREKALVQQLADQVEPETAAKELAEVRERLAAYQAELVSVHTSMMMSTVELTLTEL